MKSHSTVQDYRSAVTKLFERDQTEVSHVYKTAVRAFMSGLKKTQAQQKQDGKKAREGSDPLPYEVAQNSRRVCVAESCGHACLAVVVGR